MSDTQNPVYVDGSTVLGDGTIEHPLSASPGAGLAGLVFTGQQDPPGTPLTIGSGSTLSALDLTFDVPDGTWNVSLFCSALINNSASDISGSVKIQNFPVTKGQTDGTTPSTGAGESLSLSPMGYDAGLVGPVSGKAYHVSVTNNGADDFDVTWATLTAILVPAPPEF